MPKLVKEPPPFWLPLLFPKVTLLERLSVPEPATVRNPLKSPEVQFIVPLIVSGALPLSVALLNVRLLTLAGELLVTFTLRISVAVSDAPGTWLGDQLAAVDQFPPALLVQVMVAARVANVAIPMPTANAANSLRRKSDL